MFIASDLTFEGMVELGDSSRTSDDDGTKLGAVHIGGRDVVDEVGDWASRIDDSKVFVSIQDLQYDGQLEIAIGWGYSEYTPMENDEIFVGSHNLIKIMKSYEGKPIRVKFKKMET